MPGFFKLVIPSCMPGEISGFESCHDRRSIDEARPTDHAIAERWYNSYLIGTARKMAEDIHAEVKEQRAVPNQQATKTPEIKDAKEEADRREANKKIGFLNACYRMRIKAQ